MRNRLFFSVLICVLVVSYSYLTWSLGRTFEPPHLWLWLLCAVPFLGVVLYPLLFFSARDRHRADPPPARPSALQWTAYASMAGLSFLMPMVIARDLFALMSAPISPDVRAALLSPLASQLILMGAFVLLAIGVYTGLAGPRIKRVRISLANVNEDKSKGLQGLKLVQISDLHVGPTIHRGYVQKVVERTNALLPDFIFLTGDIADGRPDVYEADIAPLGGLRAKLGVFYVTGNHEFYWNGPQWVERMKKFGMQTLLNESQTIAVNGSRLAIAGVTDPAAAMVNPTDGPNVAQAMRDCETADFKILLAHQPGVAEPALAHGVDLQISGHTHGGQFFPWNFVVRKVHKYHQGLFQLGRMQIYVSPGTGSWGPPVRLGTRPEITQLTLER